MYTHHIFYTLYIMCKEAQCLDGHLRHSAGSSRLLSSSKEWVWWMESEGVDYTQSLFLGQWEREWWYVHHKNIRKEKPNKQKVKLLLMAQIEVDWLLSQCNIKEENRHRRRLNRKQSIQQKGHPAIETSRPTTQKAASCLSYHRGQRHAWHSSPGRSCVLYSQKRC